MATFGPGQLLLFEEAPPEDLSDLDWAGAQRLLTAERDRDLASAAPPPTCQCAPHGLHVADQWGGATCWLCGRPA